MRHGPQTASQPGVQALVLVGGSPVDEREMVERAQRGDAAAFSALYEEYFDRIYRFTVMRVSNPQDAEDLTEEVFVRMLQSIDRYNHRGVPFSAWLFRIARNQVIDHWRRRGRRPEAPLDEAYGAELPGANPEEGVDLLSDMEGLNRALDSLTPSQREVITLRFGAGLSVAETAGTLKKKDGTVKALQHNALAALRRVLEREAAVEYDHG